MAGFASSAGAKWKIVGYVGLALGIGFDLYESYKKKQEPADDPLGRARSLGRTSTPTDARAIRALPKRSSAAPAAVAIGAPKNKAYDVKNIDQRVALIQKLCNAVLTDPKRLAIIREHTVQILSQKCGSNWCVPEKDCLGEVKWIFNAIRDPRSKYAVRYVRDPVFADLFTAPERTLLKVHGEDCDGYTILLACMLMSVGHVVKIRIIATTEAKGQWAHVYLITPMYFDDPSAPWFAVDASMPKPVGWEAPGAKETAETGKPHGMVTRVKDYTIPIKARVA